MKHYQFLNSAKSLPDLGIKKYQDLILGKFDVVEAAKLLLYSLTVVSVKQFVRTNIPGADEYNVTENSIVNGEPLNIIGSSYQTSNLVKYHFDSIKPFVTGHSLFFRDVVKLHKLATPIEMNEVKCQFTTQLLSMLNTRSDVVCIKEHRLDFNNYIYFINHEYMVLTNRGLKNTPVKLKAIKPEPQEFFVAIFKLGSVFESYLRTSGYLGTINKPTQVGKITRFPNTTNRKSNSNDYVFNNTLGVHDSIHWFSNDGFNKSDDNLSIDFFTPNNNPLIPDDVWKQYISDFGMYNLVGS